MVPYIYSILAENEIRLLTILPSNEDTALYFKLDNVILKGDSIPSYEALSYTWGSTTDLVPLYLEEASPASIPITRNLAQLLPYLRHKDQPRKLWIDAICVNQADLQERSAQIERVDDLYRWAERVIVWLGTNSTESKLALSTLRALAEHVEVDWTGHGSMRPRSGTIESSWADETCVLPYNEQILRAVTHLLNRSWFERLWVWQEIRLAGPGALIVCGLDTLPWAQFSDAIYCLRHKEKLASVPGLTAALDRAYEIVDHYGYLPLTTMMFQARHCKCTDDRDRVYALLSMRDKDETALIMKADYTKTTREVFTELVLKLIETEKRLNMLRLCEMNKSIHDLPSWVPNFAVPKRCRPIANARAAGDSIPSYVYGGDYVLEVEGLSFSNITRIHHLAKERNGDAPYRHVVETVRGLAAVEDLATDYVGGGTQFDALCRALCLNRFADNFLPINQTLPDFRAAQETLRSIISGENFDTSNLPLPARRYLAYVGDAFRGRVFFVTDEGYMGLGPEAAAPGDSICVLLGSFSPILLRATNGYQHKVVGECYVTGLMCNEAFVGKLPLHVRRVSRLNSMTGEYYGTYLNTETHEITIKDPRLGLLPPGWIRKSHELEE